MDRFRQSRKQSLHKKQSNPTPTPFTSFSPQKIHQQPHDAQPYQGRFAQSMPLPNLNTSTGHIQNPSTLSRKYEEVQQKLREKQVAYRHLYDMHDKVTKEKEGIESSLLQQIDMYRNLIKQIQEKAEERLKEVQRAFKEEMERKLAEKQEEARIMQAQKQELQRFVDQLEKIGDQLQNKLNYTTNELKNTQQNLKKTDDQRKMFIQKLQASQQHAKAQAQKFQDTIDNLKQKVISTQRQWRDKIDQAAKQKQKALKDQQKQYKQEIAKVIEKHESQKNQRKDQIKNLMDSFQGEKQRLNQLIAAKEKAIQEHYKQSKEKSEKLHNTIRGYEQEIQSLASQKARLFQQVDSLNSENTHLNVLIKQLQLNSSNQKKNLEAYVLKLKDDINFSQTNFLRQRDRNVIHYEDSTKQIITLKKQLSILQSQLEHHKSLSSDSVLLTEQVRKLRDMLVESSYQLEKCKGEFIKISKERDMLAMRVNENVYEIGVMGAALGTARRGVEESRNWRDGYYLNRSRSIRR